MITLRQLEYLKALAEERHFGRAAERCAVSQPGLSTQIKLLEERLEAPVVERRKKDVLLTPLGEEVLMHAQNMLNGRDAIMALGEQYHKPLTGKLVMGVIPTIAPYLLPKLAPMITGEFPKLKLYLKEEQTPHMVEALHKGDLDVGLLALPIDDKDLITEDLFSEEFYVALPNGHPLAKKKVLSVDEIFHEDLLLLEEGHCLRDQAMEICKLADYAPSGVNFRATSLETLKCMVGEGLGITLLPKMTIRENEKFITRPLKTDSKRHIGLIWRATSPRTRELRLLAKTLRGLLK